MRLILCLVLILPALVFGKSPTLRELEVSAEEALSLASANLGTFSDPRINALTRRIYGDQRIILETIKDTARRQEIELPQREVLLPVPPRNAQDYLREQIRIHARFLRSLEASEGVVFKNMIPRVRTILENARRLQD